MPVIGEVIAEISFRELCSRMVAVDTDPAVGTVGVCTEAVVGVGVSVCEGLKYGVAKKAMITVSIVIHNQIIHLMFSLIYTDQLVEVLRGIVAGGVDESSPTFAE
jgi:hypothetical protein